MYPHHSSITLQTCFWTFLTSLSFTAVKGKSPAQTEDDEEEELRKLQAEMAM
jgi:hypothetical protein